MDEHDYRLHLRRRGAPRSTGHHLSLILIDPFDPAAEGGLYPVREHGREENWERNEHMMRVA